MWNNHLTLVGNLSDIPEIKTVNTPKGERKVAEISLATSNAYMDPDSEEWVEKEPIWHDLVAWGKTAEILTQYTSKAMLKIQGKLEYNKYQDEKDKTQKRARVKVERVEKYTPKKKDKGPEEQKGADQVEQQTQQKE